MASGPWAGGWVGLFLVWRADSGTGHQHVGHRLSLHRAREQGDTLELPRRGHPGRVRGGPRAVPTFPPPQPSTSLAPRLQGTLGCLGKTGLKIACRGFLRPKAWGSMWTPVLEVWLHPITPAAARVSQPWPAPWRCPLSGEAGRACPHAALTLLCPLQTDCALWTVQLQGELPRQEVHRAVPAEPTALQVDTALRLCAEPGQRLLALLHPHPGCQQV